MNSITLKLLRQYILNLVHEVRSALNRAKMFIQKSDKATHQNSSWIAVSLQFTFSRSQENKRFSYISSWQQTKLAVSKSVSRKLVELTLAWSVFRRIDNKPHMVEAFGAWNLCPAGRLRQKKRTIWSHTFLKNSSEEESEQTFLALSCLRWAYSIVGLWVLFFLIPRLMSCASTRLNLNTWMNGFLKWSVAFVIR